MLDLVGNPKKVVERTNDGEMPDWKKKL